MSSMSVSYQRQSGRIRRIGQSKRIGREEHGGAGDIGTKEVGKIGERSARKRRHRHRKAGVGRIQRTPWVEPVLSWNQNPSYAVARGTLNGMYT
jgi:hypothetical protein